MRNPQIGNPPRCQLSSPAACQVATTGDCAEASAATQIPGVIGSWRWMTSKRSRASTRFRRRGMLGVRTMFGSEPLAGTITDRPTGMTSSGGSPCRPWRGWSARVNVPGGSLPMIVRVSIPSLPSASAWSSACSLTPPQNDHEKGTTMPTFTRQSYGGTETCRSRLDEWTSRKAWPSSTRTSAARSPPRSCGASPTSRGSRCR